MPSTTAHALYDPRFEHDACGLGLVARLDKHPDAAVVDDALTVLERLDHRGAVGADAGTGDGAGLLVALPTAFLAEVFGVTVTPGRHAAGMLFLPQDPETRLDAAEALETALAAFGVAVSGWRDVPTNPDGLGAAALASMPHVAQVLVEDTRLDGADAFERRLFLARRQAEHEWHAAGLDAYACSLSSRTLVYKGMLTSGQLRTFYPDLSHPAFASYVALVHSRFSTNTFPSWERAQPMRFVAHNGEINTLLGNRAWLTAREATMASPRFGPALADAFPVADDGLSDTGAFDRLFELLALDGNPLPHVFARMVPAAWQHDETLSPAVRAYYAYGSCVMEPWDGPAALVATDGRLAVACLDRNGLRPCRYTVTTDGRVILASEAGVLSIPPEHVAARGRLAPGQTFVVDFESGRIVPPSEVADTLAAQHPYADWIAAHRTHPHDLPAAPLPPVPTGTALARALRTFDYSDETVRRMLVPLVKEGRDPLGSMGNDEPPAVLSRRPRVLPNYFRQRFAQVTNPPIDALREAVVMTLARHAGPEGNLLEEGPEHAARLALDHPVLDDATWACLREADAGRWKTTTLDATFDAAPSPSRTTSGDGQTGAPPVVSDRPETSSALLDALDRLEADAEAAVRSGTTILVLSDRATGPDRVPVPILLAASTVHHHLIRFGLRTGTMLVVETGEPRTVHQMCCLVGYGVDAIYPALAYAALDHARAEGLLPPHIESRTDAIAAYRKAVGKGMLKVMGKMGIATLASYHGAQIFEALGLSQDVIDRAFPGTPSRLGGLGFDDLEREARQRHATAFSDVRPTRPLADPLPSYGRFHWRAGSEHAWSPDALAELQIAARTGDATAYARFAALMDGEAERAGTIRGLLAFRSAGPPVPLETVEPAAQIVRRFVTGAMSLGSLSPEAHATLAVAMNRIGGKSNTGEGGEDPARSDVDDRGDTARSAIKQIASGRFGVTIGYLADADELQIKMAQGAKPGEGGELPGHKVDGLIARLRHATPGVGLISPPPHHDIYSIEDLKQLLHDLRCANPRARLSVKLVSEVGVGTVAAGVVKAGAAHVLVSGDSGGTGASPLTSIKHAGLPWELGLAEAQQTLVENGLRSRVVVQTDGGLRTGRDVLVAALLGAEEYGFATAPLIALGCLMMRKCHLNTCPVGVATQDPVLRARFDGTPEHVVNYLFAVADDLRARMADLGVTRLDDLIGRTDLLDATAAARSWKAHDLDLSALVAAPRPATHLAHRPHFDATRSIAEDVASAAFSLDHHLDAGLIEDAAEAFLNGETASLSRTISTEDRSVGTVFSGYIAHAHQVNPPGEHAGTPRLTVDFDGAAGQSFGAFLTEGVVFRLRGEANDYVGKGLSGGTVTVVTPGARRDDIVAGNTLLYGATSGQLYVRGRVGERFAVRNSGAWAVVEGCGDHGCEYMTGGRVAILGRTGRNLGAGMSGGIAYVLDDDGSLARRVNGETVALGPVDDPEDRIELHRLLVRHAEETGSDMARSLLDTWPASAERFVRVMPHDYARALATGLAARSPAPTSVFAS